MRSIDHRLSLPTMALCACYFRYFIIIKHIPLKQKAERIFYNIAEHSFGIYLVHMPLIVLLASDRTFPGGPGGVMLWLLWVVPISYLLGAASYAWVEVPTMGWSKKLTAPSRGGARAARPGGARAARPGQPTPASTGATGSADSGGSSA